MAVSVDLSEDRSHILIKAPFRYKELCDSIPGTRWIKKDDHWQLPTSWAGCLALRSTFRDDLVVGPALTDWANNEYMTRIKPASDLRELTEAENGDPDLFPHQRAGVAFLAAAKRALLADQPGLGKTAQAIRALMELLRRGENPFPVLVVCPNTIKINWEREFARWWPDVRVQVISGTATVRRKQFNTYIEPKEGDPKPHVIVVNWESLRAHSRLAPYGSIALKRCPDHGGQDEKVTATTCEVHERELNKIEFGAVIADEIHRAKDPKSKQARALLAATGEAPIRFALTGTPIGKDARDLWSILHWLEPREWPSRTAWTNRMLDTMMNAFGGMMVLGIKHEMQDEFYSALNPRMRRMLKDIVLPWLPPVINETREVEMSARQKKAYEQMRDHMIAELEDGSAVIAPSPLTQMLRLLQFAIASAEITVDDNGDEHVLMSEPSATVDAIFDDIVNGDFGDESVAISSMWSQPIELLSKKLEKANIPHGKITGDYSEYERQKAIDDFQEGRTKVILYTVQAGGVGVTLTKARYLLRIIRPWSLIDDTQGNDRVHRIGSEIHESIIIIDYIVKGTVMQRVAEVLSEKGEHLEEVVRDNNQLLNYLKADKAAPKL